MERTGYSPEKYDPTGKMSLVEGFRTGKTVITTDPATIIAASGIDVILEATGNPAAGIRHALLVRLDNTDQP